MKKLVAVISMMLASCGYHASYYPGTTCSDVCPGELECCSGVCRMPGPTGSCPLPDDGGVDTPILEDAGADATSAVCTSGSTCRSGCTTITCTDGQWPGTCGGIGTLTFELTGGEQQLVVPAGLSMVSVTATGGSGGSGGSTCGNNTETGGLAGRVSATITVTPGETLKIYVGGKGGDASDDANCTNLTPDGFNGGGQGLAATTYAGGGGGGGSDVRRSSGVRILVAAGGGGAGGGAGTASGDGGHAGTDALASDGGGGGFGGAGGGTGPGGGGGGGCSTGGDGGAGGNSGGAGGTGVLAGGGSGGGGYQGGGGGGGGGYGGGGGGGNGNAAGGGGAGGGGGDSCAFAGASSVTRQQATPPGNGRVVVTCGP